MIDNLSKEQRLRNMKSIKSKDSKPELKVRKLVYALGFRYRLHKKDLPGKPDLVFSKQKKIILVHGCFWHGHNCKRGKVNPKTNANYWSTKISKNISRDKSNIRKLRSLGWKILIVWECKIKNLEQIESRISKFLSQST